MGLPSYVNVSTTSSPDVFNYLIYPEQNPAIQSYLQQQFEVVGQRLGAAGSEFLETAKRLHDKFYDTEIARKARAAVRMFKNYFNPNAINRYTDIQDVQTAGPVMQRYIMAEETLRAKFHDQLCSGYGGLYYDTDPGRIGEDHYDWRRIYNGIVAIDEATDQTVARVFYEDLRTNDRELEFDEQLDILCVHDLAREAMIAGLDPSSPFGNKIG